MTETPADLLKRTPLDALHRRLGGRMIDFAGWALPVQFAGTLAEHKAARAGAALFDVSHMQQIWLRGGDAAVALERLVPGDIVGLKIGRQRYTMFLNERGGIIDDLMVSAWPHGLFLVVNAARAAVDIAHLRQKLVGPAIEVVQDRALIALQGPAAEDILAKLAPAVAGMAFMAVAAVDVLGADCWVSRSGYTGEDGFEISIPAEAAERIAERLIALGATPAGLAARDTLRLEAGLCLYGQDIDETTTPIEADLAWAIPKRRRAALDFAGGAVIGQQIAAGAARRRVGILPQGRAPARAGTQIFDIDGALIGSVTSGTYGPTLGAPVAMGYVAFSVASGAAGMTLPITLGVRGAQLPATIVALPFVANHFKR